MTGPCYRCGQDGHWQDTCPLTTPAITPAEHEARIALYVRRWQDGHITIQQKRALIAEENQISKPRKP